jgi:hypothetical protein
MKAFTATFVSIGTFWLMIQPCPAPPAIPAIVLAAGAASSLGSAVAEGAGAAAVGAISGSVAGVVGKHSKRDGSSGICIEDAINAGYPQIEHTADGSVLIHGVPESCMGPLEAWNQQEEIETLSSTFGIAQMMNEMTTLKISQIPSIYEGIYRGMKTVSTSTSTEAGASGWNQSQGQPQVNHRRAMRFERD